MLKTLKRLLISASMMGLLFAPMAALVGTASAADCTSSNGGATVTDCLNSGACLDTTKTTCDEGGVTATDRVNNIIKLVINIFSLVVGVISVIMIIVGGLKYITSSGDSGNVTGAKNTILYAIIGLVVVALAQVIVRFVLAKVAVGPTS